MTQYDFPRWLDELFLKFSIAYEGLWTYAIKTDAEILAKKLLWFGQVQGFNEKAILAAIDLAIRNFAKPPSIKEFIDLCQSESKRLKSFGLAIEDKRKAPPSPLLAEYMAKNPPDPEEVSLIKQRFEGKNLGSEFIKLIKAKLRR